MPAPMLPFLPWLLLALQDAGAPRLVLEDLAGKTSELPLKDLALVDPRERGAWIVRPEGLTRAASETPAGELCVLTLTSGDELRGRVRGGQGESLELELIGAVLVPIDISALVRLDFPTRVTAERVLEPAPEGDRLYRRTGGALDAIDGTIEGFSATGVTLASALGTKVIPWSEVAALRVEVLDGSAVPAPAVKVPVRVDLSDGSRVRGALLGLDAERCRIALGGEHEVALPLASVLELTVDDGRLVYLSELVPLSESGRGAPFGDELGMVWPHRMDANVLGDPLRAGERTYRRGVGMHAPSALTFALDGERRTLRGAVAIDDGARINGVGARGSVVFRVRKDGALAWESPLVRGGDAPLALPELDLAGAHELVLEVDPAGDFAGDRADWLRMVLVRPAEAR